MIVGDRMAGMPPLHPDHCDRSLRGFDLGGAKSVRRPTLSARALSPASLPEASARSAMRCIARTIHCHSSRSGTAERLCCARSQVRHWDRGCCGGERDVSATSRRRELVTGRRSAPKSWLEAHMTALPTCGAGTCQRKHLLTISLLLPLVAISATAQRARRSPTRAIGRARPGRAHRSGPIARNAT